MGSICLMSIFHTMLWIQRILAWSWICSNSILHRCSHLNMRIGGESHINTIQWRMLQQVIINRMTNTQATIDWQSNWHDSAVAIQCHFHIHQCHIIRVVSESQCEVLLIAFERSNIHLIPLRLTCGKACTNSPIKWYCVGTWVNIAFAHCGCQILVGDKAEIYPLYINRLQDIILNRLHDGGIALNHQTLIYSTLYWASKCSLHSQVSRSSTIVRYIELRSQATTAQQCITFYLINMLTRSQVELSVKSELWRRCAIKVIILTWRNHHDFFLHTQGERLVIGKLEEYVILFQHIQEHATELILHISTWSDFPILLNHSTGRAVKTHVK